MHNHGLMKSNIIFFTYSLSSVQSLANPTLRSHTAINCGRALANLATNNDVTLRWIPGHEDHAGNERADELAKNGTTSDTKCSGFIPQTIIKNAINLKVETTDKANWFRKGQKHAKLCLGPQNQKTHDRIIKELRQLQNNRKSYRTIVQLITGHIGLNYQLFKMGLSDTDICPNCNMVEETVDHFLGECPVYTTIRFQTLNTFYSSLSNIFKTNTLKQILQYTNSTGRLTPETVPHTSGVT